MREGGGDLDINVAGGAPASSIRRLLNSDVVSGRRLLAWSEKAGEGSSGEIRIKRRTNRQGTNEIEA